MRCGSCIRCLVDKVENKMFSLKGRYYRYVLTYKERTMILSTVLLRSYLSLFFALCYVNLQCWLVEASPELDDMLRGVR